MHRSLPKTLFSFILYFLRPYKWYALIFVGLASVSAFRIPITGVLTKHIINVMPLVRTETVGLLVWPMVLIVLSFFVFDTVVWRLITYLNYKFQPLIKNNIIRETLNCVLGNSNIFFQKNLSGRISSQITTLADNIELILHQVFMFLIHGISLLVISLIAMHSVNAIFFYIMCIWFIAFSVFSISMSKRLISLSDTYASSESSVSGQLVDTITNHNNIRMFAKRNYEISRLGPYLLERQKAFQAKELFNLILTFI